MALLEIVYGPHPIFKTKAEPFHQIDEDARQLASDMLETMYEYRGVGMAANMIGVAKQLIVVDLQQEGVRMPYVMFNPEVINSSDDQSTNEEASLSFPGISAEVTRANEVTVKYLDKKGEEKKIDAEGWFATVIQHEIDYLHGRTYLDHLSKMKRDRLIKKMQKQLKQAHKSSCTDPHCGHEHH